MRKVHFVLSALVLAAVVLQFYLAGVGVFSMPEDELFGLHTANGRFVIPVLLLLNIAAAALARGRTLRYALGLVGLLALQTVIFVIAIVTTGSNPFEDVVITTAGTVILSFHALNGLVILGVTVLLVRKAYALAFPRRAAAEAGGAGAGARRDTVTTVALLGLDLILGLVAVALWAYAAVRGRLRWALAGAAVLVARLVTVLVLAGRGWELAAERVTVGVPLSLLAGPVWPSSCCWRGRPDAPGSRCGAAAGASAVSLVLTGVVGYPGGPGAAGHDHSHPGGVSVTDLRTPPVRQAPRRRSSWWRRPRRSRCRRVGWSTPGRSAPCPGRR